MTLEQLLDCDASKLESFTDEQLLEWFQPMLKVTRPELATVERKNSGFNATTYQQSMDYKMKAAAAMAMAKQMGITLKLPGM